MSTSVSYVGEDNTGFPQIVPSLCPSGFSPLGKRTRSSSSLSSVFADDFEEYQVKRKSSQEETGLPFEVSCESPTRADSGISDSIDDLDLVGVFGNFAPTPQQPLAATPALDYSALELLVPFQPQERQQPSQPVMQAAGTSSFLQPPSQEPRLVIVEEPEEYYRARYESEGVRAPLKGANDNHPTVKLIGPSRYGGYVKVELVYEDGSLHASCSLDLNEERKNALTKKVGPATNMMAVFEDLRIRREIRSKKKPEVGGKKNLTADKVTGSRMEHGRNDKVACLHFTATVEVAGAGTPLQLSAISRPITLSTPPDPAELDWIRPESGHFQGGDEIVIKGSKMTSPKVTFQILVPNVSGNAQYDLPAVVEKDKSHQNVLLVKTPPLPLSLMNCMQPKKPIQALVTVSTGRSTRQSNPLQFWFIPDEYCSKCMQQVKMQQPIGAASLGSSPPPTPNLMDNSSLHPTKTYLGSGHHQSVPKKPMFSMQHQLPMKQEMLPPSMPPPCSHPLIGQFSPHHPMGLISNYGYPVFSPHPLPPTGETKLHVNPASTHIGRDLSTMETSGDAEADFFSYLMQHSNEDTSTSSPEPEDSIHSFPSGSCIVEPCPNLAPFDMQGQPMCTRATSFGQMSPTSVASPPGCSTPPCYSPITPVTSPQQHGAVPMSNGKVELLFNGATALGSHRTLVLSQLNPNHI